jgi:mRNA interferase MazF
MTYERGDVVVAGDPFKNGDSGRPFLVVNNTDTPFHGEQYITLSLTTRTWYEERIPISDDDWVDGGAPVPSSIMPWSVISINHEWIDFYQGALAPTIVELAAERLSEYLEG